ncbi:hypothetical protein [Mesonia ostreae]|uniref:hypothetical protein n=1 Tax=Mesonia ostreae TaxID=861110 RepID=UPI0035D05FFF
MSAKEADETLYWLKLCEASSSYPAPSKFLVEEIEVIIRILSKIISSSKAS